MCPRMENGTTTAAAEGDVEVKVVIVGAGIAGIGAGRRLMELG